MILSKKCLAIPEDTWLPTWISNRPSSRGATSSKPARTWPWSQFKFSKPLYTAIRNVVGRPLVIVNFVLAQPCPLWKERQTLPFLRSPFEGIHPNWIWTNVYLFPHRVILSLSISSSHRDALNVSVKFPSAAVLFLGKTTKPNFRMQVEVTRTNQISISLFLASCLV